MEALRRILHEDSYLAVSCAVDALAYEQYDDTCLQDATLRSVHGMHSTGRGKRKRGTKAGPMLTISLAEVYNGKLGQSFCQLMQ